MIKTLILPLRVIPREELTINGLRLVEDAIGGEVAQFYNDAHAEAVVESVNNYAELRDAVGTFLSLGCVRQENYDELIAVYLKTQEKFK